MHYLSYQDGQKVLKETEACLAEAELSVEKLKHFVPKYFAGPAAKKTMRYTPKINVPYVYCLVAGAKIKTRGIWPGGFHSRKVELYGGINLFKP